MGIKNWSVDQEVMVHGPVGLTFKTTIGSIGRKIITKRQAAYEELRFDSSKIPPTHKSPSTGSEYYLYSIKESEEIQYILSVSRALEKVLDNYRHLKYKGLPFLPMSLINSIAVELKVPIPKHIPENRIIDSLKF
jgi:hypothetical protein